MVIFEIADHPDSHKLEQRPQRRAKVKIDFRPEKRFLVDRLASLNENVVELI